MIDANKLNLKETFARVIQFAQKCMLYSVKLDIFFTEDDKILEQKAALLLNKSVPQYLKILVEVC